MLLSCCSEQKYWTFRCFIEKHQAYLSHLLLLTQHCLVGVVLLSSPYPSSHNQNFSGKMGMSPIWVSIYIFYDGKWGRVLTFNFSRGWFTSNHCGKKTRQISCLGHGPGPRLGLWRQLIVAQESAFWGNFEANKTSQNPKKKLTNPHMFYTAFRWAEIIID